MTHVDIYAFRLQKESFMRFIAQQTNDIPQYIYRIQDKNVANPQNARINVHIQCNHSIFFEDFFFEPPFLYINSNMTYFYIFRYIIKVNQIKYSIFVFLS